MGNVVIKSFKESVAADVRMTDAIRASVKKGSNTSGFNQNIELKCVSGKETETFAKCVSNNALLNSIGNTENPDIVTDFNGNNGFIYVQNVPGITYPRLVTIDVYPKFNLETATVSNLSDVQGMTNLKKLFLSPVDTEEYAFVEPVLMGFNEISETTTLEKISIYSVDGGNGVINDDIAKLGSLINLTYIHLHNALPYGDIKNMLDKMVISGRNSGELIFGASSNKLVLTYNGTTMRLGTDAYQSESYYGWKFSFSSNGWDIAETYNRYEDIPAMPA